MPREVGVLNKRRTEFAQKYETMLVKYGDPVEVLFKLTRSRTQKIRLTAAKELLSYRFPKQAAVAVAIESASQLVMSWDAVHDQEPPELMDLGREDLVIKTIQQESDIPL